MTAPERVQVVDGPEELAGSSIDPAAGASERSADARADGTGARDATDGVPEGVGVRAAVEAAPVEAGRSGLLPQPAAANSVAVAATVAVRRTARRVTARE